MAVEALKGWHDIDEVVEKKLAQQVINRIPVASLQSDLAKLRC
jgi:hypothetical protein